MKKTVVHLIASCLILLFMANYLPAAVMPGSPDRIFTGKLIDISRTKGRYKLIIDERLMFIIDDASPQNKQLIKAAKSLKNKIVTVTYRADNSITTIRPFKRKQHF